MGTERRVRFFEPDIGERAIDSVAEVLRSGWLTTGPRTEEFEAEFRDYVGAQHAVAVNSATAALHLALVAHGIGPGDEVIVPTMTFTSTAEVVVHAGARPVLVDVNASDLNIDPRAVERAITPRTKAVMPVHYGGHPAQMDNILELALDHELVVIEDAAHALPATHRGRVVGTISDATCFSFYANKTITTGEGGMVTTDDPDIADRIRSLSLHGLSKDAWHRYSTEGNWDYWVVAAGFKYNITDIASTIGIDQLGRADEFALARRRIARDYDRMFADSSLITPLSVSPDVEHARHLYVVRLNVDAMSQDRSWIIAMLHERNIGSSVHYRPLHMHPYYSDTLEHSPEDFPVAARLFREVVSLPIYPRMDGADTRYVAESLIELTANVAR